MVTLVDGNLLKGLPVLLLAALLDLRAARPCPAAPGKLVSPSRSSVTRRRAPFGRRTLRERCSSGDTVAARTVSERVVFEKSRLKIGLSAR